jgi:hypothetical protein
MATLAITITAGSETGAILRRLAKCIELQAAAVPDKVGSGASTVLTFDNAPATGVCSVQLTAGPYTNASVLIA